MATEQPITLHGFNLSGHSHRAETMLRLLDLPYVFHQVDLAGGEQRTSAFLARNPFGQVPVIEDGDVVIADSVAILVYLATRHDPARRWLPTDPVVAAEIQRWLSVAQGPVFNGPCSARLVTVFGAALDHERAKAVTEKLFGQLEAHLAGRDWLVCDHATIADVAIYSYVAHAPEGGVSLTPFTAIRRWLSAVEALPGFQPMPATVTKELAA